MCKWPLFLVSLLVVQVASAQTPLRDPTRPLVSQLNGSVDTLALHSVLMSDSRKIAVINGFTVREGEAVPSAERWVVQQIEPGAVVISDGQQRRRLELSSRINNVKSSVDLRADGIPKHNIQKQGCRSSTCVEVKQ